MFFMERARITERKRQPNREREADTFFRHLSSAAQRNVQEHVAEHARRIRDATENLQRFDTFAREAFTLEREPHFFRPIACLQQFLGHAHIDYLSLADGERQY